MPRKGARESSQPIVWIKQLVACESYQLSGHVLGDIANNKYDRDDIEHCIASGKLRKTEKDKLGESVDGKKYCVVGLSKSGLEFETVGKIIDWIDGESFYVITAYRRR